MDASVALAAAYLRWNGYFVLSELPMQVAINLLTLLEDLEHGAEPVAREASAVP